MKVEDFKIFHGDISKLDEFVKLEGLYLSGEPITKPEYKALFERSNVCIYGLWFKELLIASAIVVCKVHRKRAILRSLCVHPNFINMRIANAMLDGIEQELASFKYVTIQLEIRHTNIVAYKCYTDVGYFTIEGVKAFYEDGSDALRMQKILTKRDPFKKKRINKILGINNDEI